MLSGKDMTATPESILKPRAWMCISLQEDLRFDVSLS